MEEKSFAVGLGVMLCEQRRKGGGEEGGSSGQSVSSVLFENDVDQLVRLRCEAQAQARPLDTEDDAFNYDYEDLFRCPLHRFPHAAAAPPSTLVDERVLLIGTDQRLLASLVQRLTTLGLSRIVVALPGSSVASPKRIGARVVTFDPEATVAWTELINNSGGEVDCVVNAFDRLDVDKLASVCRFITQQYLTASSENGNKQAMSIVNVAYDDALTCTMALIGLSHTLCLSTPTPSTRPVRLNTLINPTNHPPAIETILRLIDPCSSTNGCVLHVDEQHLRCLGPPLCNASAIKGGGGKVGLLSRAVGEGVVGGEGWLRQRKRMVDVELMEALERENDALRERVEVLESEAAVKDVVDVK
ncbi:hypothetical protein [Sporisorium scitamineum]|nr:hypothetical protein [Sporisorium scitamineum]